MEVRLNGITGVEDAIIAMHMSKRSWTPDDELRIKREVRDLLNCSYYGYPLESIDEYQDHKEVVKEVEHEFKTLLKLGQKHITLLKFINLSFSVTGIHRGGQDDIDSHAKRMDNRIIRASTRLSDFLPEKSDFYEDKILTTDEALDLLNINLPEEIDNDGVKYVRTHNGYVRQEFKGNRDVERGLAMLSMPSNFIMNVNLAEFAHIYKMRNMNTNAHPEVKQCIEEMKDLVKHATMWYVDGKYLLEVEN